MAEAEVKEGWSWLHNATKWHYFVDGRSLCRNWGLFGPQSFEQGNDGSPDNCKACKNALAKRK